MDTLSTREAFASPEDDEAMEAEVRMQGVIDRDSNLKIMAAKCAKIAEQYGGVDKVAVGVLLMQAADLVNCKVTFTCEEYVYNDEFKGERLTQGCWLATDGVANVMQLCNSYYLQYLGVVDRSTKQVLALHNTL